MIRSKLYLDNKNKRVLVKVAKGRPLTVKDRKTLYRTNIIIANAARKVQNNQKWESEVNRLFF